MKRRRVGAFALSLFLCNLLTGCVIVEVGVTNPIPGLSKVAVVPFMNLSQEPTVDGHRFAQSYFAELQKVPGFQVLPVGVTETAIREHRLQMNNPNDVLTLARILRVDAVAVGAITDYSPYYPPRLGMQIAWYSPYPWSYSPGVQIDAEARDRLRQVMYDDETEKIRARQALARGRAVGSGENGTNQPKVSWGPPVGASSTTGSAGPSVWSDGDLPAPGSGLSAPPLGTSPSRKERKFLPTPLEGEGSRTVPGNPIPDSVPQSAPAQTPQNVPLVKPEGNGTAQRTAGAVVFWRGQSPGPILPIPDPEKRRISENPAATSQEMIEEDCLEPCPGGARCRGGRRCRWRRHREQDAGGSGGTGFRSPREWSNEPGAHHSLAQFDPTKPLMSYTRMFDGMDAALVASLRDYVELSGDRRSGGWEAYLHRSEDFVRFCSHLMITEMLMLHGGEGKHRIVFKLRKVR